MAKQEDVPMARRYDRLGHRRLMTGDYGRAWSHFEQGLVIRQRLLAAGGVDVDIQASLNNLGALLWAEGDRGQARAFCRQLNRLLNGRFPQAATFLQTY
jgi:hypothetical protein